MKIGLAMILLLFLIVGAMAQENCTCATQADLDKLSAIYAQLRDDSASMRRIVDLQMRKLDELSARGWATSEEMTNMSKTFNESMFATQTSLETKLDTKTTELQSKIQLVKVEALVLVVMAIISYFVLQSILFENQYRGLVVRMGVFPRRTPMTQREKDLEAKVLELEKQNPQEDTEPPKKSVSTAKLIMGIALTLIIVIVLAMVLGVIK